MYSNTLASWWKELTIEKDPHAGKDECRTTEDEMVGWHHRLNGHEFEQAPGVGDGQGGLVCHSPWGRKELDMTEWLNWTDTFKVSVYQLISLSASQIVPVVRNMPAKAGGCKRHGFHPWVGKIPWRRKWQATPVFLPEEYHGQRSWMGEVHRVAKSCTQLSIWAEFSKESYRTQTTGSPTPTPQMSKHIAPSAKNYNQDPGSSKGSCIKAASDPHIAA